MAEAESVLLNEIGLR